MYTRSTYIRWDDDYIKSIHEKVIHIPVYYKHDIPIYNLYTVNIKLNAFDYFVSNSQQIFSIQLENYRKKKSNKTLAYFP